MDNPSGKKKERSQPNAGNQKVDLTHHPVIAKLIKSHGSIPDTLELVGYLGPSDKDDRVRLYLDLNFKSYVEIPKEGAILYQEPTVASEEARPTKILVSASAKLTLVEVRVLEQVEASFLRGSIASGYPIQIPFCCYHQCYTKGICHINTH